MMDLIKRFIQNFILFQILFCFIYCNDVHAQAEDNKIFHDIEIINPVDAKNTEQKNENLPKNENVSTDNENLSNKTNQNEQINNSVPPAAEVQPVEKEETGKSVNQENIQEQENKTKEETSFLSYQLNGGIRYYQISGTDKNYNLSQTIIFKAATLQEIGITQSWTNDFRTYQNLNYSVLQVSSSNSGIAVYNSLNRILNFIVGLDYDLTSFFYIQPEFQYGGLIAFRAINSQATVIETLLIPRMNFIAGLHIFATEHLEFNSYGEFDVIIPTSNGNYGNVSGFGYEFGPEFVFKKKEWSINTKIYYNSLSLQTTPINLNYIELGFRLGISFDL